MRLQLQRAPALGRVAPARVFVEMAPRLLDAALRIVTSISRNLAVLLGISWLRRGSLHHVALRLGEKARSILACPCEPEPPMSLGAHDVKIVLVVKVGLERAGLDDAQGFASEDPEAHHCAAALVADEDRMDGNAALVDLHRLA